MPPEDTFESLARLVRLPPERGGYYVPRNTRAPLPPSNQPPIPYARPYELPRFHEPELDRGRPMPRTAWEGARYRAEDAVRYIADTPQRMDREQAEYTDQFRDWSQGRGELPTRIASVGEFAKEATGIPSAIRAGLDARQGEWGGAAQNMVGALLAADGMSSLPRGLLARSAVRELPQLAENSMQRLDYGLARLRSEGDVIPPEMPPASAPSPGSGGALSVSPDINAGADIPRRPGFGGINDRFGNAPEGDLPVTAAGGDGLPPRPNTGGGGAETLPPGALREIDDFYASVKLPASGVHRLEDVLDHPALFREFPELRGVEVRIGDMGEFAGGRTEGRTINLEPRFIGEMWGTDAKSTLLHEVQHIIDKAEGRVVQGGTPDWITRNVARNGHLGPARDMYERLGTEQTAFATQRRANMTAAERAANDPFTSEPLGYRKVPWLRRMFGKEGKPYELYPLDRPRLAEITSEGSPSRPDAGGVASPPDRGNAGVPSPQPRQPELNQPVGGPPLDMSTEARMARAREMGFDVDRPLYHGTKNDVRAFDLDQVGANLPSDFGDGVYLTQNPKMASAYSSDQFSYFPEFNATNEVQPGANVLPVFARTAEQVAPNEFLVRDPSNIRSRFAAFDPKKSGSSDLLAAVVPPGLLATAAPPKKKKAASA